MTPGLLLRRNTVVKAYPDEFLVILSMEDGYELQVGHVSRQTGVNQRVFWQWACPGVTGQASTQEAAMAAIKANWSATAEQIADLRRQQEWTEDKYALWDAGYRNKLGKGPIRCPCGEMFNPSIHAETRAHIRHITGRNS